MADDTSIVLRVTVDGSDSAEAVLGNYLRRDRRGRFHAEVNLKSRESFCIRALEAGWFISV